MHANAVAALRAPLERVGTAELSAGCRCAPARAGTARSVPNRRRLVTSRRRAGALAARSGGSCRSRSSGSRSRSGSRAGTCTGPSDAWRAPAVRGLDRRWAWPAASTQKAVTICVRSGSSFPTTAASATAGCSSSADSTSKGRAIGVAPGLVARVIPAVPESVRGRLRIAVVGVEQPDRAHRLVPDDDASDHVVRRPPAVIVEDVDVVAGDRFPHRPRPDRHRSVVGDHAGRLRLSVGLVNRQPGRVPPNLDHLWVERLARARAVAQVRQLVPRQVRLDQHPVAASCSVGDVILDGPRNSRVQVQIRREVQ